MAWFLAHFASWRFRPRSSSLIPRMANKLNKIRQTCTYVIGLLLLLSVGGSSAPHAQAQGAEHHAGIVVQFADGSTNTYCIAFTGDSISGLDVLLKTGLEVRAESYGGMGGLICKIGPDGCTYPEQPCVCQSYGPGGVYWSYTHLKNGAWKTSQMGASSYKVHDGDIDGWAWSAGKGPNKVPTLGQLCPNAQPTQPTQPTHPQPTSTIKQAPPTPTRTPLPRPTNTRQSTPTPPPTSTPRATTPPATRKPSVTPLPKPSATRRPTQTAVEPVMPVVPPVEPTTPPLRATSTVKPATSTATPTQTTFPTSTATPLPTNTTMPTQQPIATLVPISTDTATPAILPTTQPTVVATSTVTVQATLTQRSAATTASPQALAQTLAVGIGLFVVGGLLLWRYVGARGGSRQ